jgi:hypothetical protein
MSMETKRIMLLVEAIRGRDEIRSDETWGDLNYIKQYAETLDKKLKGTEFDTAPLAYCPRQRN